jgi:hypothetical protein
VPLVASSSPMVTAGRGQVLELTTTAVLPPDSSATGRRPGQVLGTAVLLDRGAGRTTSTGHGA